MNFTLFITELTKSSPLLLALGFSAMVTLTLGAGLNIQDFDILSNLAKPVNSLYTEQCPTMCTSACLAVVSTYTNALTKRTDIQARQPEYVEGGKTLCSFEFY